MTCRTPALALLFLSLAPSVLQAQSASPADTLQHQSDAAMALYNKHAYAEAAAILQALSLDPQIAALPAWPDQLYNLACDQALAGKPDQAMRTLQKSVDLGTSVSVDHIREDSDLTSLHADPRFQQLVARMTKAAAFWKDDPAIATPYKPVLSEDEKVAGLSKFWSEARFNFPFFSRQPNLDWDKLYVDYLAKVRDAQTTADYYRIMARFAAELHDGHTNAYPPKELFDTLYATPPLRTQLIGDKVLIVEIDDPALTRQGIAIGDEVLAIDGTPVRQYAEQNVAPYASSSTPQDRNIHIFRYQLLWGDASQPVHLLLRHANGKEQSYTVARQSMNVKTPRPAPALFKMLPGNIAYLQVDEFEDDAGPKMMLQNFPAIAQSSGLIIDVRANGGGSSEYGYAILRMLADKPFANSNWRTLDYRPSFRAWGNVPGWFNGQHDQIPPDPDHHFDKPVAVLIGPRTFSAAEDFVVAFDAMHRGTLIGETTGGSTGQPLLFALPGGGSARICTKDDSYPDGRVFEGVGIPPAISVAPTVGDIRLSTDPVLTRAEQFLQVSPPSP